MINYNIAELSLGDKLKITIPEFHDLREEGWTLTGKVSYIHPTKRWAVIDTGKVRISFFGNEIKGRA